MKSSAPSQIFDPSRPALNADGTLKDPSEMEWLHDPDDEVLSLTTLRPNINDPTQPALNADGTLKDASELEWIHDPEDEEINLSALPQTATQSLPRKQPRKKARHANPFIDDEAQVSDDEDADADEDEEREGNENAFLEDADVEEDRERRAHQRLADDFYSEGEMLAEFARYYVQRASGNIAGNATGDSNDVRNKHELVRCPPTVDDWPLWEIPVEIGFESSIVIRLMNRILAGMWKDPKRTKSSSRPFPIQPISLAVRAEQGTSSRSRAEEVIPSHIRREALEHLADAMSANPILRPIAQKTAEEPRSVFSAPGMKGRIYIEAKSRDDVVHLCKNVAKVKSAGVKPLPFPQQTDPLCSPSFSYTPKPRTWARLHCPRLSPRNPNLPFYDSKLVAYHNDLAFILDVNPCTFSLDVVLIPRLVYTPKVASPRNSNSPSSSRSSSVDTRSSPARDSSSDNDDESSEESDESSEETAGAKRKRCAETFVPPPAALFDFERARNVCDPKTLKVLFKEDGVTVSGYEFEKQMFDLTGFLLVTVNQNQYHHVSLYPSLADVKPFLSSASIDDSAKYVIQNLAERKTLKEGTQVKVVIGEHQGLVGKIVELNQSTALLEVPRMQELQEVPVKHLRRYFKTGDMVQVTEGEHQNLIGWVVNVDDRKYVATLYIHNHDVSHIEESIHRLNFATIDLEYGKYHDPLKFEPPPPLPKREDMRDKRFDKLHRLPAVIIKGPLKGRKGRIISVDNHQCAQVELDSRMVYTNGLVSLHIEKMLYELPNRIGLHTWEQVLGYDPKKPPPTVPVTSTIQQRQGLVGDTMGGQTPMPAPSEIIHEGPWDPSAPEPAAPEPAGLQTESAPSIRTIPPEHWLVRIGKYLGPSKLQIRLQDTTGGGLSTKGTFTGIDGAKVQLLFPPLPGQLTPNVIVGPFEAILPVHPVSGQYAYIIDDSNNFGKQCYVWKVENNQCVCGTIRGKFKFARQYVLPPTSLCVYF